MRRLGTCRVVVFLIVLGVSLVVLLHIGSIPVTAAEAAKPAGAEKPKEKTVGPFAGVVLDPAGKPVGGAKVLLLSSEDTPMNAHIVVETTSDEKGRFQVGQQKSESTADGPRASFWAARDSQGRIGAQIHRYNRNSAQSASERPPDIEIKLQEARDRRGRLLDASGQAIAKATIRPQMCTDQNREEMYSLQIFFPAEWQNEMAAQADADGWFTLRNMPGSGTLNVKIQAEGFGEPGATLPAGKPSTLKLARLGAIHGAVVCERDPKATGGIKLRLFTRTEPAYSPFDGVTRVYYFAEGVTHEGGAFRFEKVPAGQYQVTPSLPPTSPYYWDSPGAFEVKAGEDATASLVLKPALKVQGKVVDGQTGAGVAGVRVSLYFPERRAAEAAASPAETDAQGAFTLHTRPGKGTLQIYQLPESYLAPSSRQSQSVEVQGDITLDPIRLERVNALEGVVVDGTGKPVADAEIRYMDADHTISIQDVLRSDAAGKFTLKKIAPKKTYFLRVRTSHAVAEPASIVPEQLKEPLRVVVDEKIAFAMRALVTDEEGKPLPRADVSLVTHWSMGSGGIGFIFTQGKTDDAGRIEFGGLWAGDQYQIRVNAKDHVTFGSPLVKSTPGDVHDFGKIVLAAANGVVEGKVVDSSGKPVADARVFNSGDGIRLLETRSDGAGKFRLEGFCKGPVYVFAEKDGYRFSGVPTTAGATDAVLTMLRIAEPPPQRARPSAPSADEEKQSARKLLERLWPTASDQRNTRRWILSGMAKIDPQQARKWAEDAKIDLGDPVSRDAVKKMADEDLEEALSVIAEQGGRSYYYLEDLVKHFAASDPQKALRCAEEGVIRARNLDQPQRAVGLAKMAAMIARLGNTKAAKKLATEAADMAGPWQPSDQNMYSLGSIAVALAPLDMNRSLELIGKIKKEQRRDFLAKIAASMDDLEKAESLLKDVEPWLVPRARMQLAYRIAATRPADAVRLVEKPPAQRGYGNEEDTKALAFGWLATAIAPRDPAMACALVDRAFEIYLAPQERSHGNYGGRATQAALLAVQAQQIGYPDMQSVLWRTLAARPVADKDDFSPARALESRVMMAMFLALVDAPAAKQMLQALQPQSAAIGSGYSGVGRDEWLKAWAAVDPAHATELAEAELASANDDEAKDRARSAAMGMVDLWTTPSAERLKYLSQRFGHVMGMDQED